MLSKLQNLKWPGKSKSDAKNKSASAPAVTDNKGSQAGKHEPTDTSSIQPSAELLQRLKNPSEKIRTKACLELRDVDRLLEISKTDSSENIQLIAARQYARLQPADESIKTRISDYFAHAETKHLARLITAHHNDDKIRQHGLTLFDSDEDLLDIAIETRFHDTRQTVANKIKSLAIVDQCLRKIKSKDKIVARELKQRLTKHHDKIELHNSQQAEIKKITDEMQKLAEGAWSPTFSHRYELFANKWNGLDFEISEQQKSNYETQREIAHEKVSKNKSAQKNHDEAERIIQSLQTIPPSFMEASIEDLPVVANNCDQLQTDLLSNWQNLTDAPIDKQHQQQFTAAKTQAQKHITDAQKTLSVFDDLEKNQPTDLRRLTTQLKTLETLTNEVNKGTDKPLYTAGFPELVHSLQEKIKQQKQQTQELKASINKQFGSLNSAISANRWGPAKSIHERLSKKIDRLGSNDKKQYAEKLERLEKKLNDLGDWKEFATEPKLESLCELMEQVPALGLSPKDQADRIKDLQAQWKSMGANPAQEKHWPRFKAAADLAYEPCAKYFADKRAEKDARLSKRTEICDMLQTYIDKADWQTLDSKLVEKTIRTAKTEWRNTRVFDRKAGAKLEERFTAILATLNEKLEPAYEAGTLEKTGLIEKVKALGEGDVNQHCINQVKRLQSMWKRTGATRRADDQKLWTEFNDACSAIYNAHRGKQREQYAASVEHVTRARQIIAELKSVRNSAEAVDEKAIQQLQDEFEALPEFPEKDQKHLFRDFNRAVDGVEQHRHKMVESAQQQEIQRLHHNARLCDQLEALAGSPSDEITDKIEQILDDWNEGEKSDKPQWKKAINLRKDSIISHLNAGTLPDFESNTKDRRLLCIENEILHEKETPAEDKQLRMQHQLEKLQQGMSAATATSLQEKASELEFRWLTSLPAAPDVREKLNTRFNTATGK